MPKLTSPSYFEKKKKYQRINKRLQAKARENSFTTPRCFSAPRENLPFGRPFGVALGIHVNVSSTRWFYSGCSLHFDFDCIHSFWMFLGAFCNLGQQRASTLVFGR